VAHHPGVGRLPTGTVTFLFTDVEGSTRLLHELGDEYANVLAEHRRVLRQAFTAHDGVEVDTQGDAFFFAFAKPSAAVSAASAARDALAGGPVRVRMGVHTGEPVVTDEGYVGIDVHRAARIAAAGHGGQILVSQAARDAAGIDGLRDLGEHRLKDLSAPERIYQLGDDDFPPLKSRYNNNLPIPADPLVGRKKEIADVLRSFRAGARVVTVTGPGGIGKTRFALQVAAELIDDFKDGVWWVGLAPLRDPTLVLSTIAAAIGAQSELEQELRGKHELLLLDNFEQVVAAAAELAALQTASPDVVLLVTSREPLHIAGEREYQLPPLAESPAVELFRQRAFSIDADYPQLVELCERVDRLPLAIELAAARTKILSIAELLQRLDERLPLLTSRRRDVDERQRTLRATIEWSYDLLGDDDKERFGRLSVFAGSFDVTAAQEICDTDLDGLESLVDKSLLRRTEDARFFMFETIREFASHALDADVERRHAAYYLSLAQGTRLRRRGDLSQALALLDAERENVRAALSFYDKIDAADELARLIDAVAYYWFVRGDFREGDRWIELALNGHAPDAKLAAELLVWRSDFVRVLGDLEGALAVSREALVRARALDDARLVARSLHEVGESYFTLGDGAAAAAAYEEAIEAFREAGESPADTLGNLGDLALSEGRFEEAARRIEESRALLAESAEIGQRLIADYNYVVALLHLDRTDEGCELLKDVLVGLLDLGYVEGVALALLAAATALRTREDAETAAELFGAAERILEETGAYIGPTERRLYDPLTAFVRDRDLDDRRGAGRALTVDQAVDLAIRSLD
jgi:predicted ATPase/class 3 adenylate cyclase